MKCLAVLLFSLLAEKSFAINCDSDDRVDTNLLSNAYSEAVKSFPLPSIENDEQAARTFEKAYTQAIADYGSTLTIDIYNQTSKRSRQLIVSVKKDAVKLHECIESIKENNADSTCLDVDLKVLTKQLKKYLTLSPGNVQIKRQALPDLPAQLTEINSTTEDPSAAERFLNLTKRIDENFTRGYALIIGLALEGWRGARLVFDKMQTQIRNEFLNGPIMNTYTGVSKKVLRDEKFIKNSVDKETWDSFKNIARRIITIFDDYNASKKKIRC